MRHKDQAITITQVSESQKALLARLMQLYLHDFSEFVEIGQPYGDVNADGVFDYEYFESYWSEPEREPLLITFGQNIVGFALINAWSASGLGTDQAIAEFFILRKYRRAKLGTRAAMKVISDRSGRWEIPIAFYNRPALAFWRSVVLSLQGYQFEEFKGDRDRWSGTILRGNCCTTT